MTHEAKAIEAARELPFECTNCGHKPTPRKVLEFHGDCEKCGDTVVAYTVDAAEYIESLSLPQLFAIVEAAEMIHEDLGPKDIGYSTYCELTARLNAYHTAQKRNEPTTLP